MTALAAPETAAKVSGLTRLDKHELVDGMSSHELRALARHLIAYAPEASDRAIAERLAIRGTARRAARKGTP